MIYVPLLDIIIVAHFFSLCSFMDCHLSEFLDIDNIWIHSLVHILKHINPLTSLKTTFHSTLVASTHAYQVIN
jgi:hypothetical protein